MGAGKRGPSPGQLLLDPQDILVGGFGGPVSSARERDGWRFRTVRGARPLNVNTAFANLNFSQITLQATRNITLSTLWNLSQSTGVSSGNDLLTLQAGGDIIFKSGTPHRR